MAAVGKAYITCDSCEVIISKKQQVLGLVQPDKFNILLAALSILLMEYLCKVGIAHVAFGRQVRYIDIFMGMLINIKKRILNGEIIRFRNGIIFEAYSLIEPYSEYLKYKSRQFGINICVVAIQAAVSLILQLLKEFLQINVLKA